MKPRVKANRPYYADELALADYSHVLRGVYVGGCIHERNAWGIWESTRSHAHNYRANEFYGWICILKPEDVLTASGRPTATLLHELGHLLAPDAHHSRAWKRAVISLGIGQEITRCGLKELT